MVHRIVTAASARWVELAAGVALHMREGDGADVMLAEQKARAAVRAMIKADGVADDYGLGGYDFSEYLGADDVSIFSGFGQIVFAVELAMILATDLRGVAFDQTDEPPEWCRRSLTKLFTAAAPEPVLVTGLSVRRFSSIFLAKALKAPLMRAEEGNVSGAAPGTSGMAAPRTAETAE